MKNPLFLLGAGFNKDAKQEAGVVQGDYEMECEYPLVNELVRICFDKDSLEDGRSIEEWFAEALEERNYDPIKRLYDALMKADYHLGWKLRPDGNNPDNCYATFFQQYNESSFLTFNYDSLPEFILFRMGQWYPHDGYGVPLKVGMEYGANLNTKDIKSSSLVLHLHGSLCIYTLKVDLINMPGTNTRWLSLKEKPEYIFDPESISLLFTPFTSPPLQIPGPDPIEHRVIAPVRDKKKDLGNNLLKRFIHKRYN